ncbi:hypothetical protein [Ammoniphilus sp. 3BR4]|uniref:hypothetical protein n=1 Tax=Ammoniphilus sp. 3BR4 TaxID=3158265 RepID=UPI003464E99D
MADNADKKRREKLKKLKKQRESIKKAAKRGKIVSKLSKGKLIIPMKDGKPILRNKPIPKKETAESKEG